MPPAPRSRGVLVAASVTLAALAACAPQKATTITPPTGSGSASAPACSPATMQTLSGGKLTIGTDNPVYEPWFTDNKPENGQGFEGAVAYAVATKLGYANSDVVWT